MTLFLILTCLYVVLIPLLLCQKILLKKKMVHWKDHSQVLIFLLKCRHWPNPPPGGKELTEVKCRQLIQATGKAFDTGGIATTETRRILLWLVKFLISFRVVHTPIHRNFIFQVSLNCLVQIFCSNFDKKNVHLFIPSSSSSKPLLSWATLNKIKTSTAVNTKCSN